MDEPFKIFIGYDSREDIAWQICRYSLLEHSTIALQIEALKLNKLKEAGIYTRSDDKLGSTEFTISRFLTPFLAKSKGWSMFVDCDFLFTADIGGILANLSPDYAAYVVKHDYTPALPVKMDGKVQHVYPRKNWSSLMLFNGNHPKVQALTPELINTASPAFLHRFEWLEDHEIGELAMDWNFLVGEYPQPETTPRAIHFTNGGPWMQGWANVDYADLWLSELSKL